MDTVTLREEIKKAQDHETRTHELATLLGLRLKNLHSRININRADPRAQLLAFVDRFVSRTPNVMDTLQEIASQSPWDELIETLSRICMNFFASPPHALQNRYGMVGAMGKSYLCHRLVEEINDSCRLACDAPLIPIDFTCSNLIIHQLIGEPFANHLDDIVRVTAVELDDRLFVGNRSNWTLNIDRLLARCHQRSLLDEVVLSSIAIAISLPGCTVH